MKKLKILFAGLTLTLTLGAFNSATFTARADDSQQGTDGTKPPPCFPRCRPVSAVTPGPEAPLQAAASTSSVIDTSATTDTTLNELLVLVFTHFVVMP